MGCGGSKGASEVSVAASVKPAVAISEAASGGQSKRVSEAGAGGLQLDASDQSGRGSNGDDLQDVSSSSKYRTKSTKAEIAAQQIAVAPRPPAGMNPLADAQTRSASGGGRERAPRRSSQVVDQHEKGFFDFNELPIRPDDGSPAEPITLKNALLPDGQQQTAASTDPWASLQSQYNISAQKSSAGRDPEEDDLAGRRGPSRRTTPEASTRSGTMGRRGAAVPPVAKELVLDDIGGGLRPVAQATPQGLPPRPVPRGGGGGWDKGSMAKAGTIMVDDNEMDLDMYGATHAVGSAAPTHRAEPPPQKFNGRANNDVTELNMEDFDEIESLLKEEPRKQSMPSARSR